MHNKVSVHPLERHFSRYVTYKHSAKVWPFFIFLVVLYIDCQSRRPDTTHVYDIKTYFRTAGGNFTTLPQYFKNRDYEVAGMGKIFHPGSNKYTQTFFNCPDIITDFYALWKHLRIFALSNSLLCVCKCVTVLKKIENYVVKV